MLSIKSTEMIMAMIKESQIILNSDCVTEYNNKIMEDNEPQKPKGKDGKNSNHKNQV